MDIYKTTITRKASHWTLRFGGGGLRKRKTPTSIFRIVESRLLSLQDQEKIAVIVKYGKDASGNIVNETIASSGHKYQLYCLLCFLEDYLSPDYIKEKELIYGKQYE